MLHGAPERHAARADTALFQLGESHRRGYYAAKDAYDRAREHEAGIVIWCSQCGS